MYIYIYMYVCIILVFIYKKSMCFVVFGVQAKNEILFIQSSPNCLFCFSPGVVELIQQGLRGWTRLCHGDEVGPLPFMEI